MKLEGERDMRKYLCEFLGTCVLVLFGCGVAAFSGADLVATSLAFGLSIVALAYTIGKISGCHVNPAVSFAMWIDKRMSTKDFIGYVVAQVLGAIVGAGILALIIKSTAAGDFHSVGLGTNGYGEMASSGITTLGALVTEIVLTFVFVLSVLGVTRDEKKETVAPIVIGLSLVLVHLLGIHLTGTSVNPARSLAPAIFMGGEYLEQVWVFIVGPLVGAAFAALAIFFIDLEDLMKEPEMILEGEEVKLIAAPAKVEQEEKIEKPEKKVSQAGRKKSTTKGRATKKPTNKKSQA